MDPATAKFQIPLAENDDLLSRFNYLIAKFNRFDQFVLETASIYLGSLLSN